MTDSEPVTAKYSRLPVPLPTIHL